MTTDLATTDTVDTTVGELAQYKREIVSHFTQSMEELAKCGAILKIVQSLLDNETSFRGFCLSLPFTYRSAYNYMRLYEHSVSVGIETMLQSKVDATAWYRIPVGSEAATEVLERAKRGQKVKPDEARQIVQSIEMRDSQASIALEQIADKNPRQFSEIVERGVITNPVTGDEEPLSNVDASALLYASDTDESERIKRQRVHIENSKQARFDHTITFFVEGQPLPKERARHGNNGVYTPQRTQDYETHVGWSAKAAMGNLGLFTGDCSLSATFYRKGNQRADLDNLIKSVKDGMNGVVYDDDKQVIEYGYMRVVYGSDTPGVQVIVSQIAQVKTLAA